MTTTRLFTWISFLLGVTAIAIECPDSWITFHDHCYLFSVDKLNWFHATKSCKDKEALLVAIESAAEDTFLKQSIVHFHLHDNPQFVGYWTSANDLEVEGRWVWGYPSDNQVTYADWHAGEPNNVWFDKRAEDCVVLWGHSTYNYTWNDQPCDIAEHYICEIGEPHAEVVG
ncbi:perlucin-like protein [Mya arenaria]|uniref:perlucin-like protein n=1 Tax=Mya arenaria TaxID=6604 RepID=UPI0022E79B09|nr:perlucin-like protein [Mya arenaria]